MRRNDDRDDSRSNIMTSQSGDRMESEGDHLILLISDLD